MNFKKVNILIMSRKEGHFIYLMDYVTCLGKYLIQTTVCSVFLSLLEIDVFYSESMFHAKLFLLSGVNKISNLIS